MLTGTTLLWVTPLYYGSGSGLGLGSGAPALNRLNRPFYSTGRSDNFVTLHASLLDRSAQRPVRCRGGARLQRGKSGVHHR